MNTGTQLRPRARGRWLLAATSALALGAVTLTGCAEESASTTTTTESAQSASAAATYFTTDRVHAIDVQFNQSDYDAMLDTYAQTGDKEWLSVTLTIDGNTFDNVGLRLKGNRTLREMFAKDRGIQLSESDLAAEETDGNESATTTDPATIPWLIRLDKFVDGQSYLGRSDFVVRSNNTDSYLNEAVMMAMLTQAGLPAEQTAFTSFTVNDSEPKLRLVIEVPDDEQWNDDAFGDNGSTWKADADGDWDYHGSDGSDYESIWKQRTGDEDMTPIVEFMDFINNATDEEFASSLGTKLDVEEFAKYLAIEDLFGNDDTISGPGNNGYLHYNPDTGLMTVVAWDHDLGLGVGLGGGGQGGPGGMGGPGEGAGMTPPDAQSGADALGGPGGMGSQEGRPEGEMMAPPEGGPAGMGGPGGGAGMTPPDAQSGADTTGGMGGMGGPGMGSNILESRFRASEEFMKLYDQAYKDLKAELITSGFAEETLDRYADLLKTEAANLISTQTVEADQATISQYLNNTSK